jgi:hypothetical protein
VRVLEALPRLNKLVGQSLAVLLGGRQVVFLLDLRLAQDLQVFDLYLEHPTVLVGVALGVYVLGTIEAIEKLSGESPHPGVHRAGLVHELQREVRRPAAIGAHGRLGSQKGRAQFRARPQVPHPETLLRLGTQVSYYPF